jgi:hypothetical protein
MSRWCSVTQVVDEVALLKVSTAEWKAKTLVKGLQKTIQTVGASRTVKMIGDEYHGHLLGELVYPFPWPLFVLPAVLSSPVTRVEVWC